MTTASRQLGANAVDFIDEDHLHGLLAGAAPDATRVGEIIAKALAKQALSVEETAALLAAEGDQVEEIFAAARQLKRTVYGNRIVRFSLGVKVHILFSSFSVAFPASLAGATKRIRASLRPRVQDFRLEVRCQSGRCITMENSA